MASPFVFPDVATAADVGARAATSSYIARICLLMEEEEDVHDEHPDHPALLHAQQTFAQILSSASLSDHAAAAAALPKDTIDNPDMFTAVFFKGVEEASKFLPADTDCKLVSCGQPKEKFGDKVRRDRHGAGHEEMEAQVGRTSKLPTAELEEASARDLFDEMMLRGYDVCSKGVDGLCIDMDKKKTRKKNRARWERRCTKVVDLHTLLIHCAKAVTDDRTSADLLLKQIKEHASPTGDATQRMAYWFAQGLEARLAGTGRQVYRSLSMNRTSVVEFLEAYKLFMSTCCFRMVAFAFANKTIFGAAMGRSKLHIVDYGLHYGFQWPELLRLLGARDGGPPQVRITSIDLPQPGFRPANHMAEMRHRLSNCAREFGVPFKFQAVLAPWETVRAENLNVEPDEALVVNDVFNFRTLMDESIVMDNTSPRDVVLNNITKMKPDVFIQGIVNGSYGTTFLSRFREALFDQSALFDMLDATMPQESQLRLVIERDIFGWVALNVIACEGEDRVERGETYKKWQVRNQRAGLRQLPLNREILKMATDTVKNHYHKNFIIEEEQQWLLQGWKGRILLAHSTWVADDSCSGCSGCYWIFEPCKGKMDHRTELRSSKAGFFINQTTLES
ncbi:hypothetical protein EJB05_25623, partial [Eragrostis curvula]